MSACAMEDAPVNLSSGPLETFLPEEDQQLRDHLESALTIADLDERRSALQAVVVAAPTYLEAWARLSENGRDDVESYAYARIGYHRGLDALRKAGWRGNGYVRWRNEVNRGFLRSLERLRAQAIAIGEATEAERCALFLHQLDPDWGTVVLD